MAKTERGKKVVPAKQYALKIKGKTVRLSCHKRSTHN